MAVVRGLSITGDVICRVGGLGGAKRSAKRLFEVGGGLASSVAMPDKPSGSLFLGFAVTLTAFAALPVSGGDFETIVVVLLTLLSSL